jgi:hypothetical protein
MHGSHHKLAKKCFSVKKNAFLAVLVREQCLPSNGAHDTHAGVFAIFIVLVAPYCLLTAIIECSGALVEQPRSCPASCPSPASCNLFAAVLQAVTFLAGPHQQAAPLSCWCLQAICGRLPLQDRCQVRLVSRHWRRLAGEAVLAVRFSSQQLNTQVRLGLPDTGHLDTVLEFSTVLSSSK